jgi:hypothetical protein
VIVWCFLAEAASDHAVVDDVVIDVTPIDETVGVAKGGGCGNVDDVPVASRGIGS